VRLSVCFEKGDQLFVFGKVLREAPRHHHRVRDPLDEILLGKLEHGGTATIGVDGDKLTFSF